MRERLRGWLAIAEIEADTRLRTLLAFLLFYCVLVLDSWSTQPGLARESVEAGDYMPFWPVEALGWQPLLTRAQLNFVLCLGLIAALLCILRLLEGGDCTAPTFCLLLLTSLELFLYLHDLRLAANFFHVHLYLSFFFLCSRQKLFFFRTGLWMVYWLAAMVKLTPSWLWGEYFNSVPARLPLFPGASWVVTAACLALLCLEFLGPFAWLSSQSKLRYTSVGLFVLFHLYSGVLVGHWYTTLMLPLVVTAFIDFDKPHFADYQFARRDLVCWLAVGVFLLGGVWNFLIPGDVRTTAEGRYHGLFMFDANRRVEAEIEVVKGARVWYFRLLYGWPRREILDWSVSIQGRRAGEDWRIITEPIVEDGVVVFNPDFFSRNSSRMFGDPYVFYLFAKRLEQVYGPDRIGLRLRQQLDGHANAFLVVDEPDFLPSRLGYNGWGRNSWIRLPGASEPEAYRWW